jgi:ribonuclease D
VKHESITTQEQLTEFCRLLASAKQIAFDTEFVSEDTYRPQLCLVQVAAADRLAVIDPLQVRDLVPFWTVLADGRKSSSAWRRSGDRRGAFSTCKLPPA